MYLFTEPSTNCSVSFVSLRNSPRDHISCCIYTVQYYSITVYSIKVYSITDTVKYSTVYSVSIAVN